MESSGHAEAAEADYYAGMKYKDIATKYGVSLATVKSWKLRYGWDRKQKSMHTKAKKVCIQNTPLPSEISGGGRRKIPSPSGRYARGPASSPDTTGAGRHTNRRTRPDRNGPHRAQFETNRKIILATQSVCAICGLPVDKSLKSPHPMSATVDHIIPIAKRGDPSALENLQLAHRACNRAKSDKLIPQGGQEKAKEIKDPNRDLPQTRNWKIF